MKICYIAPGYSEHTRKMAEYFALRGDRVSLVSFEESREEWMGIDVRTVGPKNPLLKQVLYRSPRLQAFLVGRVVAALRPDIVHAHYLSTYGVVGARLGRRPLAVSAWGSDLLVDGRGPKQREVLGVLAAADLVHSVSRDMTRVLEQEFGVPGEKIFTAPFGIDTDQFSPQAGRPDPGQAITVVNHRPMAPVYDNATLVRGFALAAREIPGLRLVLVGDGPDREKVRQLVQELGLGGSVSMDQWIESGRIPGLLRDADVFVSTNISDGTPVSLLEAMSTGLACVATGVGGVPDWITDGEDGLILPPSDPRALADRILLLARDAGLRSRLGKAARDRILARGRLPVLMEGLRERYEALSRR